MKKIKKEILEIDEAVIFLGYTNKKEAKKDFRKIYNEDIDVDFLEKVRIKTFKKDGEDWYYWGTSCDKCGTKNDGIPSFIIEN